MTWLKLLVVALIPNKLHKTLRLFTLYGFSIEHDTAVSTVNRKQKMIWKIWQKDRVNYFFQ